jgi:hypothetical protein
MYEQRRSKSGAPQLTVERRAALPAEPRPNFFQFFREKKVIFTVSPINCELPGLVTVTSTVLYRYARFAVDRSVKDKPEGNSVGLGQGLGQPQQKAQLRAT